MDQAAAKRDLINRLFNLAEVPVRDWLLRCCVDLHIRGQYESKSSFTDVIMLETDSKHYVLTLKYGNQTSFFSSYDKNKFLVNENLKEAVGLLFQAVNMVYMPVMKTLLIDNSLDDIFPKFDNDEISFSLVASNSSLNRKLRAEQLITEFSKQSGRTKECQEQMAIYNNITDEMIMRDQEISEKKTEELKTLPKLYIVIEETKPDMDVLQKRLDVFVDKYEDID